MNIRPLVALLVLPLVLVAACGDRSNADPIVSAARIVLPPPGAPMAAGYFELTNPGDSALVLNSVRSDRFASVEMHETIEDQGVSRMRSIAQVEIPAGSTARFEPGGRHLMLMGPRLDAIAPAELPLTLEVQTSDGRTMKLDARFAVENAGEPHAHHH